jgi:hypothetical protein
MTSAQRKFEWGVKHLNALRLEAQAFENSQSYVLRKEVERRSAQEVAYVCFAVPKKPLPDHWPLLLGDAVQNLRSSLDHAIYTAAKGQGRTQFPIIEDPGDFQSEARKTIATIPSAIQAIVEQAQPFNTIIGDPHRDALAVLADLSNADKHRNITAAVAYVGMPILQHLIRPAYGPSRAEVGFTYNGEGKPLASDKETHVASFVVRGVKPEEVYVQPDFSYEVQIERTRRDRRTLDWIKLRPSMEVIERRVAVVLNAVETGQPLGAWLRPAI